VNLPPNRLISIIATMESGAFPTQEDIDRAAALQALDFAVAGRQFVEDWIEREEKATEQLTTILQ
jgi:hypothetical protein